MYKMVNASHMIMHPSFMENRVKLLVHASSRFTKIAMVYGYIDSYGSYGVMFLQFLWLWFWI